MNFYCYMQARLFWRRLRIRQPYIFGIFIRLFHLRHLYQFPGVPDAKAPKKGSLIPFAFISVEETTGVFIRVLTVVMETNCINSLDLSTCCLC